MPVVKMMPDANSRPACFEQIPKQPKFSWPECRGLCEIAHSTSRQLGIEIRAQASLEEALLGGHGLRVLARTVRLTKELRQLAVVRWVSRVSRLGSFDRPPQARNRMLEAIRHNMTFWPVRKWTREPRCLEQLATDDACQTEKARTEQDDAAGFRGRSSAGSGARCAAVEGERLGRNRSYRVL